MTEEHPTAKPKVKLKEIIDALEMQSAESSAYLDLESGTILIHTDEITNEILDSEPGELEGWIADLEDEVRLVAADTEEKRFLPLPSQYDIHEYSIMEDFCRDQDDPEVCDQLLNTIRGRGAFRMFKDAVYHLGIREQWFRYREEALADIARRWCRLHEIEYEE